MQMTQYLLLLTAATVLPAVGADQTAARLGRASAVLTSMIESKHSTLAEKLASADCVAVIPGFKKGAAVVGAGYGRGYISCRNGNNWSAPGAITLETGSLGVQLGGEEIDIVALSLDRAKRAKLLSDRFAVGADASAAWGNGKTAHEDPNAQIIFYGHTKGTFAGFGLDGATLKSDDSTNKTLYGMVLNNGQIVAEQPTPAVAQPFVAKLESATNR